MSLSEEKIIGQLTFEEKVKLVSGQDIWRTAAIERLDIPYAKLSDGPNGCRGGGDFNDATPSTLFPSPSCLGSSWDDDLAYSMGRWIALDAIQKQCHVVLGPTINIQRDPRAGRYFESYSEDPTLTGYLASAWVRGCQSTGVGATMKHFVGNESETERRFSNSLIDPSTLREVYLEPFRLIMAECFRKPTEVFSQPSCVMTGYNFVNDVAASQQTMLFNQILREEWGFDGCVVSDWFALHASALEVTDLEMPGPSVHRQLDDIRAQLKNAAPEDRARLEADIDRCAANVVRLLSRVKALGYCAKPEDERESSVMEAEVGPAIRQIGAEGAVLLKNEMQLLPLQLRKGLKILCVGLPWVEAVQSGGGSANLTAQKVVQPIDALRKAVKEVGLHESDVHIGYQRGCSMHNFVTPLDVPMQCQYYSGRELGKGELVGTDTAQGATVKTSDAKPEKVVPNQFWMRCTVTTPAAPVGGKYRIGLVALGQVKAQGVYADGQKTPTWEFEGESDMFEFMLNPRRIWKGYEMHVEQGQSVQLTCDYLPRQLPEQWKHLNYCGIQIGLELVEDEDAIIDEAVKAAVDADIVVVLTAAGKDWESEGYDRDHMRLPRRQNDLVQRVGRAAKGKTAVMNITGSPIELPWLADVTSLVQSWYGGQEGGESLIDVLLGRGEAPACGRLANTWPKKISDHPSAVDQASFPGCKIEGKQGPQVTYIEGRLVGYRHFNTSDAAVEPAYYMGSGIGGFTSFSNEGPSADNEKTDIAGPTDLPLTIKVKTKNTGERSGKEIIQLYVRRVTSLPKGEPKQRLVAYKAVRLRPGEEACTSLTLRQEAFSEWSEERNAWTVEAGAYEIALARSANLSDTIGQVVVNVTNPWTWQGLGV